MKESRPVDTGPIGRVDVSMKRGTSPFWSSATSLVLAGLTLAMRGSGAEAQQAELAWGRNSYGASGLIDMPVAHRNADGELASFASYFGGQARMGLTFQFSKRLSATFRYSIIEFGRLNPGNLTLYDRSFSLHYRMADEGDLRPAIAVGLNDILGTGVYSGEYLVATKTFSPRLRGTLGIGWGRLGGVGEFANPLGILSDRLNTRPPVSFGLGGMLEAGQWFRGDAAFFGGVEWMVNDRLRLVAEYSSDRYRQEDGAAFEYKLPVNLGLDWQYNDRTTLSARYLYGSEFGLQFSYAMNPKYSAHGSGRDSAPPPIRPADAAAAKTWGEVEPAQFSARLEQELGWEGLELDGMRAEGSVMRVQIRNSRFGSAAQATGRAARVLSRLAPAEVSRFEIVLAAQGMPITEVSLNRSDLEELEFDPVAPDLLRIGTMIENAPGHLDPVAGVYPRLAYGIEPYLTPSLFDPDDPLRIDLGAALYAKFEPTPGLLFSGRIHQKLFGNLDNASRMSNSVLTRVRSDANLYFRESETTLQELTAAWYFRPAENFYGRVTAGYLEMMFGGLSAEILWKPQNSALALGVEINHVKQRDFDQFFGFQDYAVTTGHVSAYYEWAGGYQTQLDVGRYLAGDVGATLTLSREFDNGWRIGAFATITNVSAKDFGEGSFDKGIILTIPLDWASGKPTQRKMTQVVRSVQRDGGARLYVPGRLYETVRGVQATELNASWGRFWK